MSEHDFNPNRRLCPDGSCIGVMKDDGHCSVCGRDAQGVAAVGAEALQEALEETADAGDGASAFDANRRLCEDGSCVGVIGPDGRCGVCGQPGA
jgi:hypothetical protein